MNPGISMFRNSLYTLTPKNLSADLHILMVELFIQFSQGRQAIYITDRGSRDGEDHLSSQYGLAHLATDSSQIYNP